MPLRGRRARLRHMRPRAPPLQMLAESPRSRRLVQCPRQRRNLWACSRQPHGPRKITSGKRLPPWSHAICRLVCRRERP
jgi:hypothetical protein